MFNITGDAGGPIGKRLTPAAICQIKFGNNDFCTQNVNISNSLFIGMLVNSSRHGSDSNFLIPPTETHL